MLSQEQLSLIRDKIINEKISIAAAIKCINPDSNISPERLVEIQKLLFSNYQDLRKVIAQIHLDEKIAALIKRVKWIKDRGGDVTDVEKEILKVTKQKENLTNF
jgi:hypothetical protein